MVGSMQTIELAQHGCRCRTCCRFVQAGDQHFDAGPENEGFLMVQGRPLAGRQDAGKKQREQAD
jgi:hypothetical protein